MLPRRHKQANGRLQLFVDSHPGGSHAGHPVLVLLHAFPLSADMWAPQLAAPPAGWRVIAPDLRGFGPPGAAPDTDGADDRRPGRDPSIDDYAEDVLGLLDALEFNGAVIAGLSMGGYVALALLRLAPARVRALVLADTRFEADTPEARAGRGTMIEELARGGSVAIADAMVDRLLGATSRAEHPQLTGLVREMILANRASAIHDSILRLRSRPDSSPLLPTMTCPALVIVGAEDELTPVGISEQMAARIPGARLAVIQGSGHLSNLEQPGLFNARLDGFLSTLPLAD